MDVIITDSENLYIATLMLYRSCDRSGDMDGMRRANLTLERLENEGVALALAARLRTALARQNEIDKLNAERLLRRS